MRYLPAILILTIIVKIISSLYYSHQIVTFNNLVQKQRLTIEKLSLENQQLEIDWTKLNRLENFNLPHLRPIKESIKLSP